MQDKISEDMARFFHINKKNQQCLEAIRGNREVTIKIDRYLENPNAEKGLISLLFSVFAYLRADDRATPDDMCQYIDEVAAAHS